MRITASRLCRLLHLPGWRTCQDDGTHLGVISGVCETPRHLHYCKQRSILSDSEHSLLPWQSGMQTPAVAVCKAAALSLTCSRGECIALLRPVDSNLQDNRDRLVMKQLMHHYYCHLQQLMTALTTFAMPSSDLAYFTSSSRSLATTWISLHLAGSRETFPCTRA